MATGAAQKDYNFLCNTFEKVGGGNLTLGDVVPGGVEIEGMTESMLQFFNANGGVAKKDFGGEIGVQNETYVYVKDDPDEPWVPGGTGWYLMEGDDELQYPQNDRVFKPGDGFVFNCAEGEIGMKVQISSAIK